jgi:hypothetical protein
VAREGVATGKSDGACADDQRVGIFGGGEVHLSGIIPDSPLLCCDGFFETRCM